MTDKDLGSNRQGDLPTEKAFKPVLVRLSDKERACLEAIYELGHGDMGYGIFFRSIVAETGLTLREVRRSVRACARKGVAEYIRGLFTDDGMVAGSGNGITPAGRQGVRTTTASAVGTERSEVNQNNQVIP